MPFSKAALPRCVTDGSGKSASPASFELDIEKTANGNRIFFNAPPAKISVLEQDSRAAPDERFGCRRTRRLRPLRVDVGVVWLVADLGESATVASVKPKLDQVQTLSAETQAAELPYSAERKKHRRACTCARSHRFSASTKIRFAAAAMRASRRISCTPDLFERLAQNYLARQGMAVGRAGEIAVR